MSDGQFLHYDGSAVIGGTEFPSVSLREHREGGLQAWGGSAALRGADAPGFAPDLAATEAVAVELPDGRHGKALVTNVSFDGQVWRLELTGTGPAPGYPQS